MKNNNIAGKERLKKLREQIKSQFCTKTPISTLIQHLVDATDKILVDLFHKNELEKGNHLALVGLGSYGRRELQFYSDIDLLLLYDEDSPREVLERAQQFIQDCWDVGWEVSHQITTVNACANLAEDDLSVISTLLDMRLVCGRSSLLEELSYQTHSLQMWNSTQFFLAKEQEQRKRYEKYAETAYNLEPNVKNGPGGLRDLLVLMHVAKRHYGIKKISDGINGGFITDKEYEEYAQCLQFLWRVRFALHLIAQKKEDRLIFDYQTKLASMFDFQDNDTSLAIEQFMKVYFKHIKRSRELNEMLLQWFSEAIVHHDKQKLLPIDDTFQLANHLIEIKPAKSNKIKPLAILQLFVWQAKCPQIEGVRANTIRLIRQHLYLLDQKFIHSSEATTTFIELFKTPHNPYEALQRMSRYGVLGRYLESFSMVTGQMQYDLFHVFTVEQHTLFVIRNLARFASSEYAQQFLLCTKLMEHIPKREILYLAALFHDIGKGHGGDHSELGAIEAEKFAIRHHLLPADRDLLVWLVRHHLLMSHTAQRQDVYDPKTIQDFCAQLPYHSYLDYIYLLTVADICATNPALWNAWKDSLLKELYYAATTVLCQEQNLLNEAELINLRKTQALDILTAQSLAPRKVQALWKHFKGKYFLHESAEMIAQHTAAILTAAAFPLVLIMPHHTLGGTEVFIYMPHREDRFAVTTTVLSNHHVTIQEAMISTCDNQFDLDTYIILDQKNQAFLDQEQVNEILNELTYQLKNTKLPAISKYRISRTQAHFKIKPQITYSVDRNYTRLFLVTADRPGLLARISHIFYQENIHLHNAKIATAGERVEDTFYVSNQLGETLTLKEQDILRKRLYAELTDFDRNES